MRYTIVGFGDSITEAVVQMPEENKRWLNVLSCKLENTFPEDEFYVINAGVGGNSDREKMARFEKDVLVHDPDFILLEFGGNNNDPNRPERRVSLEEAGECLAKIKNSISAKTKIIVITFPPLIEEQHQHYGHEFFKNKDGQDASCERFRELSRDFARANNLSLVDFGRKLKAKMKADGENVYVLSDGVHLTEQGNQALAELVFLTLKNKILIRSCKNE